MSLFYLIIRMMNNHLGHVGNSIGFIEKKSFIESPLFYTLHRSPVFYTQLWMCKYNLVWWRVSRYLIDFYRLDQPELINHVFDCLAYPSNTHECIRGHGNYKLKLKFKLCPYCCVITAFLNMNANVLDFFCIFYFSINMKISALFLFPIHRQHACSSLCRYRCEKSWFEYKTLINAWTFLISERGEIWSICGQRGHITIIEIRLENQQMGYLD